MGLKRRLSECILVVSLYSFPATVNFFLFQIKNKSLKTTVKAEELI
jgi:hypothetical protein